VLKLVKVSEVVLGEEGPPPHPEAPRLPLDDLGIVEEAVEDLPKQDHWHQNKVDTAEDEDVGAQTVSELLPLGHPLVVLPQVPLVEGRPWRLEEDQLQVELEPGGEEGRVADQRQAVAQGEQRLQCTLDEGWYNQILQTIK
jgi:hypothetical protein